MSGWIADVFSAALRGRRGDPRSGPPGSAGTYDLRRGGEAGPGHPRAQDRHAAAVAREAAHRPVGARLVPARAGARGRTGGVSPAPTSALFVCFFSLTSPETRNIFPFNEPHPRPPAPTGGRFAFPRQAKERTGQDRKSTRLNSSHSCATRIPSSA